MKYLKYLNASATEIFSRLLKKLKKDIYTSFATNDRDLIVAMYDEYIRTELGDAKLYSMGHFIQTPDGIFPEPEMLLIVVDNRATPDAVDDLYIIPHLYQQYTESYYHESTILQDGFLCSVYPEALIEQVNIAENWLARLDEEAAFD
ncbi:MAG: hypothetical protein ACTHMC_22235 [Pseudobacter sp.]|uniref:hypothetical protein n=1 Tax=Pseudobacter sp. TaxID=2045420 RepID=UPI003F7E3947